MEAAKYGDCCGRAKGHYEQTVPLRKKRCGAPESIDPVAG
jgi:ubiquitin